MVEKACERGCCAPRNTPYRGYKAKPYTKLLPQSSEVLDWPTANQLSPSRLAPLT